MAKVIKKEDDNGVSEYIKRRKGLPPEDPDPDPEPDPQSVDGDDSGTAEPDNQGDEPNQNEPDETRDNEPVDYEALFKAEKDKAEKRLNQFIELSVKNDPEPQIPEYGSGSAAQPDSRPAAVKFLEEAEIDDEAFTGFLSDKREFVSTLNEFGNKVRNKTVEEIMVSLPNIVQNAVSFTVSFNEMNREFFNRYPELAGVKKYVSAVADEMMKERRVNDLEGYEQVLKDLPGVISEKLGIELKERRQGKKPTPQKPLQATPAGQRRGRPSTDDSDLSPLQRDLKRSLEFIKKKRSGQL